MASVPAVEPGCLGTGGHPPKGDSSTRPQTLLAWRAEPEVTSAGRVATDFTGDAARDSTSWG